MKGFMEKNEILLIPKSIPCPHCGNKIWIVDIMKYFGKITNVGEPKEEDGDKDSTHL